MNASTDLTARQVFLDDLRNRVALRSVMHRDDIDDVQILEAVDADVAATRELLRVCVSPEATGEINASDVLEVIEIVAPAIPAAPTPPAATRAMALPAMPPPYAAYLAVDPIDQSCDEDAFYATMDPPSTGPVTFPIGEGEGEGEGELEEPAPRRQRRLGWIVATVLTCAVTLAGSALVTERLGGAASAESARSTLASVSPARQAALSSPPSSTSDGSPWVVSMDVKNLPPALAGTIQAPSHRALFVDEQRVQGASAVVTCGKHQIRTGMSKKTRSIDVPCGGTIAVR